MERPAPVACTKLIIKNKIKSSDELALLGHEQLCPMHHPGGTTGPPPPDTVGPDPTAGRHIACSDAPLVYPPETDLPAARGHTLVNHQCHYCIKNLVLALLFDDELEIFLVRLHAYGSSPPLDL